MLYGKSVVVAGLIMGMMSLPLPIVTTPVSTQTPAQASAQKAEGNRPLKQGYDQVLRGQSATALKTFEQALAIFRRVKSRNDEAGALMHLGIAYQALAQYEKAIEYYQQALSMFVQIKNRQGEVSALTNLICSYFFLSKYEISIAYSQRALSILDELNDQDTKLALLNNLAHLNGSLGLYKNAITYFQQALAISVETKNRYGEAIALSGLGLAYRSLSQYERAIYYYQQALSINVQLNKRDQMAIAFMGVGNIYSSLSQPQKAITYFRQALYIFVRTKDRYNEANTLKSLGLTYSSMSQPQKALLYFQQALPIFQEIKNLDGEGLLFSSLGSLYEQQQPEAAISFYKQSVNVLQTIRKGIRKLPRDEQEAYTQAVSSTYRALADLLLRQGRIAEAQQVLELLKLQELREYGRETRTADSPASIALDESEMTILKAHSSLVAFAQTLRQCTDDAACARSPRLKELTAQRDRQNLAFANLIKTLETKLRSEAATDQAFINPNDPNNGFRQRAENILNSQPGTLLIYPLILEDKMWLLVGSPGPVFTRYEVKVGQKQLAETILQFRTEMRRCEVNPCTRADTQRVKQISQKLYQWLFPPQLQKELQATTQQPIRNLVFAPDRSTRYIPMGALFDGEKYLIERYTISTIVAASITNTTAKLSPQSAVLAMGVSDPVSGFGALPNVPIELDAIVKTKQTQDAQGVFPGTQFLNQGFTKPNLQNQLPGHEILHLATHAKFEPGALEQSFLLLGNGDRFKAPDIRVLNGLPGVHLVVLSACETALGGRRDQDGIEIAGLNNAFLERGAKAVIASLWQVNDPSTSVWMQQLYQHFAHGTLTKSQAIQAVQLNFIQGKVTLQNLPSLRAGARRVVEGDRQMDLRHPYYWAPFILVGNPL